MAKKPKGMLLTPDGELLFLEIARRNGLSQNAQFELLIREEARRLGINLEELKCNANKTDLP